MIKHMVFSIAVLLLAACTPHDEQYYREHPQMLQEALKKCPSEQQQVSCQELNRIAREVNQLAYELQANPQGFGRSILALQMDIFKPQTSVVSSDDVKKLNAMQQELAMRLAMVKWLEAPG